MDEEDEFALPPPDKAGRPYSLDHRLGRVMRLMGWSDTYHLGGTPGVDISPRMLSRYLAGEKIPPHHLQKLAEVLECPEEYLQEVENGGAELPDSPNADPHSSGD